LSTMKTSLLFLVFFAFGISAQNISTPFVEAYWESWNSVDSLSTIVGMDTNVITVAFATFTQTGSTFNVTGVDCSAQDLQQILSMAHSAGKFVKMSFGGATYGFSPYLTSVSAAQEMAQAIANFVQQYGFDGADFDIEDYPAANLQIALLQAVRDLLPNALISYTPKAPASTTAPYDQVIQGAYESLTSISIMAYDAYQGYSYQTDVQGLLDMGVPANKIVVGLMPGDDDMGTLTTLADVTIAAQFAQAKELGGVMIWDLNRDHENLTGLGVNAATDAAYAVLN